MMMTKQAYEHGEFSQAQEEAGAAFVDALEELAFSLSLDDGFTGEVADAVDQLIVKHLPKVS